LLERFLEIARLGLNLIEQPRILDGDHGLVGKSFQEIDLALREGAFSRPH